MRIFVFVIFWCLVASQALASGFIPKGSCTIVLSSRPDLAAALEDVRARWQARDITIYKSANGWYAITQNIIPSQSSATYLAQAKAAGRVPPDALCSAGANYIKRVTRLAAAQDGRQDIFDPVNAARLSSADQRFTQLGLAFRGDYSGLLDGAWGGLSQRALDQYAAREFGTAPHNWQLAALAFETFDLIETNGWRMYYNDWLKMSYLFPFEAAREGSHTEIFTNYEHRTSSLRYSFARTSLSRAEAIHQFVAQAHGAAEPPYSVRRDSFAVTFTTGADGARLYARSRFVEGLWSTVMISVDAADRHLLGAVSSSITDGFAAPIRVQQGGVLSDHIDAALAFIAREATPQEPAPREVARAPQPASPSRSGPAPQRASTGTGFVVAAEGDVLTNAHVVEGCSQITVDGQQAEVRDISGTFDLALLSVETEKMRPFAKFANTPASLNSDVTVVGFPLSQDLGGLNVTRGSVSAAKGLGGDATNMQITAPIQPGNSGGPVLGGNGAVVGVVVSKLDEQKYEKYRGITPQNVNFAIRGEIAKLFLFQNDVVPALAEGPELLDPVALARQSSAFTVLIECLAVP